MRNTKTLLFAGIAAAALVGFAGLAQAQGPAIHTMTLQLPGGGIEQVRYTGDVAPRIVVAPGFAAMSAAFGPGSPFAAMEAMSAQMDRQMDAVMQQVDAMQMMPMVNMDQLMQAAARNGGANFCSQSVQITSMGNGQPARVVTHSAGNCGGAAASMGNGQANAVEALTQAAKPIPMKAQVVQTQAVRQHI